MTPNSAFPRALQRLSLLEGVPVSIFGAWITGAPLTGYALYLGASPLELGLISGAPLLGQVLNPLLIRFSERASRPRNLLLSFALLSRAVWLGVAALPLLEASLRLPLMITLASLSWVFTSGVATLLTALLGDLIPHNAMGRFFGLRNALLGAVGTAATLLGGVFLDRVAAPLGFQTLILAAALIGLGAVGLLLRYPQPSSSLHLQDPTPRAPSSLRDPAFRRLLIYAGYWSFAASLSAPFVIPFLLIHLDLSYGQVGLYSALSAASALVFGPMWGRLADRVGNKPGLYIVTLLASTVLPLSLLLATPQELSWVWLAATLEGVVLSALGFGLLNLTLSSAPEQARPRYLATFTAVTGVSGFVSSALAGPLFALFAAELPRVLGASSGWTPYHALLLTSALLRLPALFLLSRVTESGA